MKSFRFRTKTVRKAIGFSIALAIASNAAAFNLSGTVFEKVGEKHKVDPLLLYAIAITESAAGVGKGNIQPQPYVFRTDAGPQFFDNLKDAQKALAEVLKTTKNIDVGMMQVNLKHHPQKDPLTLLDPMTNLSVASMILRAAMESTDDRVIGVGRYHSWRSDFAEWYGQRVWKTYANLTTLMAYQE